MKHISETYLYYKQTKPIGNPQEQLSPIMGRKRVFQILASLLGFETHRGKTDNRRSIASSEWSGCFLGHLHAHTRSPISEPLSVTISKAQTISRHRYALQTVQCMWHKSYCYRGPSPGERALGQESGSSYRAPVLTVGGGQWNIKDRDLEMLH